MSKNIFKSVDIKGLGKPVTIESELMKLLRDKEEKELESKRQNDKEEAVIRITEFENKFQEKKKKLLESLAQKEKEFEEKMIQNKRETEKWALEKVKQANQEGELKIQESQKFYEKKIQEAENKCQVLITDTHSQLEKLKKETYEQAYEEGFNLAYEKGKIEIERLVNRLNVIISSSIQKRNSLIEELESQIVDIIILITRKVIKSISQDNKKLIYDNVVEALRLLKGRTEIIIRVNSEDLPTMTKHKKELIELLEGIESLKILEDNSIDRGGCYISTEFGELDARISTQLSDIEEKIKTMSPIKEEF